MAILDTDLETYLPLVRDDSATNGGRMTYDLLGDGLHALFPVAGTAERAAGSTKWRKAFGKLSDSADQTWSDVKAWLDGAPTADAQLYFAAGTDTDTQGDLSSPRLYGTGTLDVGVSPGATSLDVLVADGAVTTFADGDLIRIWEGSTSEWATVSGAPSVLGDVVTLPLAAGVGSTYTTAALVGSVLESGDIVSSVSDKIVTSATGTFDLTAVTAHNLGAYSDTITVTFTAATTFTAAGTVLGSLGAGNVGSVFAPSNPDTASALFTIPAAAWGGTYLAGDTVSFILHPSTVPHWRKRVIPAGAASASVDIDLVFEGDTGS